MKKVEKVLVAARGGNIVKLTCAAAQYGRNVTLIYAGDKEDGVNADKAYYIGSLKDESLSSCAAALAELIKEERPELVLLDSGRDGRLLAAHIAAACGTSVQTDALEIFLDEGGVRTSKMIYGGAAIKTEESSSMAVVCIGAEAIASGTALPAENIKEVTLRPDTRIKTLDKKANGGFPVNLAAAKKVVGVGRGLADLDDLASCQRLADAIGADIGCTRPVCEERKWMARERYIGVSGQTVRPECYLAIGISGQIQHVVGINKSGTIIAIDKNESAPIFKACDYGIVGDLHKIVPALQKMIEA